MAADGPSSEKKPDTFKFEKVDLATNPPQPPSSSYDWVSALKAADEALSNPAVPSSSVENIISAKELENKERCLLLREKTLMNNQLKIWGQKLLVARDDLPLWESILNEWEQCLEEREFNNTIGSVPGSHDHYKRSIRLHSGEFMHQFEASVPSRQLSSSTPGFPLPIETGTPTADIASNVKCKHQ
jgi:hypothetical protein